MLAQDLGSVLATIQTMLGRIEKSLDGKADKADLTHMDQRVARLEEWRHDKDVALGVHTERDAEVFTRRQKVWGVIGALAVVSATMLGPTIATLVH